MSDIICPMCGVSVNESIVDTYIKTNAQLRADLARVTAERDNLKAVAGDAHSSVFCKNCGTLKRLREALAECLRIAKNDDGEDWADKAAIEMLAQAALRGEKE